MQKSGFPKMRHYVGFSQIGSQLSYSLGSTSCIGISQPKNTHIGKSQHETILADLNRYMTATRLVIILTDDAIKHTCIWPLA